MLRDLIASLTCGEVRACKSQEYSACLCFAARAVRLILRTALTLSACKTFVLGNFLACRAPDLSSTLAVLGLA